MKNDSNYSPRRFRIVLAALAGAVVMTTSIGLALYVGFSPDPYGVAVEAASANVRIAANNATGEVR